MLNNSYIRKRRRIGASRSPRKGTEEQVRCDRRRCLLLSGCIGDVPGFVDILAEVFDLGDPEEEKALDGKFDSGKLILGYLDADGELDIHVPLERNEYVEKRLQEVFDG
jgi:hypothetical protein